jgi:hypothetical protein
MRAHALGEIELRALVPPVQRALLHAERGYAIASFVGDHVGRAEVGIDDGAR